MEFNQILTDLKNKKYHPIYFLSGSDPYYIDKISDYIENNVLTEGEKSFNQSVLYGKDIDFKTVVDTARRYPMMSQYQVVIIKEAQDMKDLKDLQSYIEKPMPTTILVICHKHKSFNAATKFGKLMKKNSVYFASKKLYDNQVPDWIRTYLQSKKLKVSSAAANLMGEYLGTDLSKVSNELDKLVINLQVGTEVTPKHVETQIGISREYNIFELQKALGQRDIQKANRIVNNFIANPKKNPLVLVVGTLFNYFSKIYMFHSVKNESEKVILESIGVRSSYFLREYRIALKNYNYNKTIQVISILKEFDLKSKGVDYNSTGKPEGELLKEMIWRILHWMAGVFFTFRKNLTEI